MIQDRRALVLAVHDTINRVRRGDDPYATSPIPQKDLLKVSETFSQEVNHDALYAGIEERFIRGDDPRQFITDYLSVVFAQGFSAGIRFEERRNL